MPFQHEVTPLFPDISPNDSPDITLALEYLGKVFRDRRPTMKEIKTVVCEHYSVTQAQLESHVRGANIVRPRQIFYFLSYKLTGATLPAIGRRCGGRDHTTVLWGVQRVEEMKRASQLFNDELETLRFKIAKEVLMRIGRINHGSDEKSN